jgi:SAM-dependent methyltransferase
MTTQDSDIIANPAWTIAEVSDGGERVTHLSPNDCYYAHLSLYYFSLAYCKDGIVLDAGSGAGYGSNYLAKNGVRQVKAIDISEKAIAFSKDYFQQPNLEYQAMDLQEIIGFEPHSFDFIFSSNTLEHVPDLRKFFQKAWSLLKSDGSMMIVVPPIAHEIDWSRNIDNVYHLNIWTPRQWYHVLNMYFDEVRPYWHGFDIPGVNLDFHNTPEETVIDEKDFTFKQVSLEEFYTHPTLSVIFIVRQPRDKGLLPDLEEPLTFVDKSFTRPFQEKPEPETPPWIRQKYLVLRHLINRSKEILQEEGLVAVIKEFGAFFARKLGLSKQD